MVSQDQIRSCIEGVEKQKDSNHSDKFKKRTNKKTVNSKKVVSRLGSKELNDTESDYSVENRIEPPCLQNLLQSREMIDDFKKSVSSGHTSYAVVVTKLGLDILL